MRGILLCSGLLNTHECCKWSHHLFLIGYMSAGPGQKVFSLQLSVVKRLCLDNLSHPLNRGSCYKKISGVLIGFCSLCRCVWLVSEWLLFAGKWWNHRKWHQSRAGKGRVNGNWIHMKCQKSKVWLLMVFFLSPQCLPCYSISLKLMRELGLLEEKNVWICFLWIPTLL